MANTEKPQGSGSQIDASATNIPGMTVDYTGKPKIPGADIPEEKKKEMEEVKKKLEKFKKIILDKYKFTLAVCIIPPYAADKFDEEMELTPEEKKEKPMHVVMVIPEEHFKEIGKIRTELINQVKEMKPRIWLNVITPVDLWNYCLDGKYDIAEAIGMSFPLYDKGILGALRVAQIHKSLCLKKFERYIYSYVIGGSLVRGEAIKTSDVDVFVVIDDTDVKRMPRIELKEKLRNIIYSYISEASQLAGVKNLLNVQVYLLTEFWESVKDAHPVIFTFIRDGIPLYDRGGFTPWKLLLKMGKIKPSPEAIDLFMSSGDKMSEMVKRRLMDLVIIDIYWGVLTPSQALLMLYGLPPPNVKETVKEMKRIFVDKEKILEKRYIDILEEITIKYYKGYEHGKVKEIKGAEVDKLLADAEDYMKRLKELRVQIEKRAQEKTVEQVYEDVFKLLKGLFGDKPEGELVKKFEKELINKGRTEPKFLHVLNEIIDVKRKYKSKKKPTKHEIETIRKNAVYLINNLIDYGQRCELAELQRNKVRINYGKGKSAELLLTNPAFVVKEGKLYKLDKKLEEAKQNEFESIMQSQKGKPGKISKELMKVLRKEFGEGFEVSF